MRIQGLSIPGTRLPLSSNVAPQWGPAAGRHHPASFSQAARKSRRNATGSAPFASVSIIV